MTEEAAEKRTLFQNSHNNANEKSAVPDDLRRSTTESSAADEKPQPAHLSCTRAGPSSHVQTEEAGGDAAGVEMQKKRAADSHGDEETSKAVSPKKTRLFGSLCREGAAGTKSNFFSSALNKLASQNIEIRPLTSTKPEVVDDASEDSRMSWTAETPKVFGDLSQRSTVNEVVVETGEENEQTVLEIHGKLYMFSSECGMWKERGRGILKLNDKKNDGSNRRAPLHSRLVMRSAGTLRLILNSNLFPKMDVTRTSTSSVRFSAAQQSGALRIFSIKASASDCDRLMDELQYRVERLATAAALEDKQHGDSPLENKRHDDAASEEKQHDDAGLEHKQDGDAALNVSSDKSEGKDDLYKKWLQIAFMKVCRRLGASEELSGGPSLVLLLEKFLKSSAEEDVIYSELTLMHDGKRSVDGQEKPIFRCSADEVAVRRVDDVTLSLEHEQTEYILKFSDSVDAIEVLSSLQDCTEVVADKTPCESTESSSTSYVSARNTSSQGSATSADSKEQCSPEV